MREQRRSYQVLPRLSDLESEVEGEGINVTVRFVKKGGLPVRYVAADDPTAAAAVREVDLQRKYHRSAQQLAEQLGLTVPKAAALRRHLGIDNDDSCVHTFAFGKVGHRRFSDNAYRRMREALDKVDMEQVWRDYRPT